MSPGDLLDVVLGKRLPSRRARAERVGALAGISLLGLDALASAAYGPEAALTVLMPLGAAGSTALPWVMAPIILLLVVVGISYGQTITAYPGGGAAYTVAKENLGTRLGVLAGAALALDYILNVAVAISAGVGALVSAIPALQPHTLALCLLMLLLLTIMALRGVREAATAWSIPTYLFVGSMLIILATGAARALAAGGHPHPLVAPPAPHAAAGASAWLLVRAFASGCTAMTGVEAVSNGVPLFRDPAVPHARRTLAGIVTLLVVMLVGIALLARAYGINATTPGQPGYRSVLSMLYAAVAGQGLAYQIAMAALLAVLCLSASTSFTGFPALCRVMAQDGFLPEEFAQRGRRLVYSRGIVILALIAAVLLIAFGGVTDRLIPLFAIGALLAFTVSQAAMVVHWRRTPGRGRHAVLMNGIGAAATGATLAVVLVSKFTDGAWVSVLIVAALLTLFWRVRRYHRRVQAEVGRLEPVDFSEPRPPLVIVPLTSLDRVAGKALRFAAQLSPEVEAVRVRTSDDRQQELGERWGELVEEPARRAGAPVPRLVTVTSDYREFVTPLVEHVLARARGGREVVVVVPELVPRRWYHHFLTSHRATLLKAVLLWRGGPRVIVANTPWYEAAAAEG
jgi:amino acid transporter